METPENTDLNLNREQEIALAQLNYDAGFRDCYVLVLQYLIKNFGKKHKHTIDVKLLIQPMMYKKNNETTNLMNDSKLSELFLKRSLVKNPHTN